jgi:poly-gamma-glutamate synthesis protein (capsule biosynthesis protein)
MKALYIPGIVCALFCSCTVSPRLDELVLNGGGQFPRERDFLRSCFGEASLRESRGFRLALDPSGETVEAGPDDGGKKRRPPERPDIFVDFVSSWEFEDQWGGTLLSKTWYVPQEDPLAGRGNTELAACLEGGEKLIPLTELAPPFTALRVGGLTVGDEGYPLVKAAGIRIRVEKPSPEDVPGGLLGKKAAERKIERANAEVLLKIQALEAALQAAAKPLVEDPPGILWIAAGGDLMLGRGAEDILFAEGPGGILGGTAELLVQADLALVNLEGAISSRGTRAQKAYHFRFDPKTAAALGDAGIDGVLLANNHVFDYGEEAFFDTLGYLKQAGIAVLGAGSNDGEAARPFVFQKGGQTARVFGIASFPREKSGWDGLMAAAGPEKAGMLHARNGGGEKLKTWFARHTGDSPPLPVLDMVLFHGGNEWDTRPDGFTRNFYTDLIRHGADAVIGSHPHVVQGFEWVLGKPVFWSLGNYVFGGMEDTRGGEDGLFIRLGFSGSRLIYLEPFAITLVHTRTTLAPAEKLNRFYALSRELKAAAGGEALP